MSEWTNRAIAWHRADPTSHWLKVVDDETGAVLGGGRWSIYESNPYDHAGKMEASWWPEGTPRDIATDCLNQFLATSAEYMNKPHAFLNILFTHPDHRRKGVAALVINWGLEQARQRKLEAFIEATPEGKPVYERLGFSVLGTRQLQVDRAQLDKEGRGVVDDLLPFQWWSMWKAA